MIVSILLVVELAFEEVFSENKVYVTVVSILLVVELAFEEQRTIAAGTGISSFNPSCSGIGF